MSRRPVQDKKVKRLRRTLERGTLTSYIDLIDWLKTRGYAQTTGEARRIILARRVRSESHPLGVRKVSQLSAQGKVEDVEVVDPYVPAELRPTLRVEPK
jgi:hypothetical protein